MIQQHQNDPSLAMTEATEVQPLGLIIMSLQVLLNCLIALMSDACAKVNDEEGWQFFFCRAQVSVRVRSKRTAASPRRRRRLQAVDD